MRITGHILLFITVWALCHSCVTGVIEGEPVPDILIADGEGETFRFSQVRGSYVLLDFWGSWCGPCLHDAPRLVSFHDKYQGVELADGHQLVVVSIALERSGDRWKAVADKYGFDWTHQLVEYSRFVRAAESAAAFGVTDIPAKFLIGPEGTILVDKGSWQEIETALGVE